MKTRLPGPKTLQRMLRTLTEALARELARPSPSAPLWTDIEWRLAHAVCAMHGVSPLLARCLPWSGPGGWRQFLEEQRLHTKNRHARITQFLREIDQRMGEAGVAAVALKGVALHALGVYRAGDRPMADIDLLVRPADTQRSARALESMGLRECYRTWKERVFTPVDGHPPGALGEHSNNNIKLELHERIGERLPWQIVDISEHIFPRDSRPGLNAYPSTASLMMHLLLHAAGSMAMQGLRLMHVHDLAQLSLRMTHRDWDELLAYRPCAQPLWWALPPLKLTARYYSSQVPPRVLEALAEQCPYLLARVAGRKTLSDVSYSYPWVDALPGIEWSQSLREVLQYAHSRVRPTATQIALREQFAHTQGGGLQSPWHRLSQRKRMVRWITSNPTRPLTMHAVAAALAPPP
ncbi:MAG TPA: nucleotidyltransferase family protein [Steroidobacteraceae bacterium]|jgi:hypothetical protein